MIKKAYFTKNNISFNSSRIMDELNQVVKLKTKPVNINKSALLILDMQQFFLDETSHAFIPSSKAIIPNINLLINIFEKYNRPVIFTKHINNNENAGLMANWWNDTLTQENPLSWITPLLDKKDNIILKKSQYDAFYNTDLEKILMTQNIQQIFITGVMTHLCCETTARSAFTRGFQPFFIVDGTATYNEAFHKATILNLSHGFAMPMLTKNLQEEMNE